MMRAMFSTKRRVEALERVLGRIKGRIRALETAPAQGFDDSAIRDSLTHLQDRMDQLQLAVSEGIERVDRSERRVRAVVQRAKARMDEAGFGDEALDAEAEQLSLIDGGGSARGGVSPVREGVADDRPAPAINLRGIPGAWTPEIVDALTRRMHGAES